MFWRTFSNFIEAWKTTKRHPFKAIYIDKHLEKKYKNYDKINKIKSYLFLSDKLC